MENKGKIYSKKAIALGTFLGSPLVAGYLMAKNYKVWGDEASAKQSMIWGVVSTLVIAVVIVLLPEEIISKVPNYLIPVIYTAIIQVIVEKYQSEQIEQHLEKGFTKQSYWKAAGAGVVGCISVLAIIVTVSISQPLYPGDVKTYGTLQHEVYFDDGVTSSLSDSLAASLTTFGYFNQSTQGAVHIGRRDEYYVITLPFQKEAWNDEELLDALRFLKDDLKTKFHSKSIILRLHHFDLSGDEYEEI